MPVSEMILKGLSICECGGHGDHGMRTILEHDTQNYLKKVFIKQRLKIKNSSQNL